MHRLQQPWDLQCWCCFVFVTCHLSSSADSLALLLLLLLLLVVLLQVLQQGCHVTACALAANGPLATRHMQVNPHLVRVHSSTKHRSDHYVRCITMCCTPPITST
jgi:hypothetical protein